MPDLNLTPNEIAGMAMIITLIGSLIVKELATSFVVGLLFKLSQQFKAGDDVLLEDQKAIIISIGIRNTVFQIDDEHGTVWRYVANTKMKEIKLAKIVRARSRRITLPNPPTTH